MEHPLADLVLELGDEVREEVLPALGRREGREHAGDGAGGDVTFAIDEQAEARMESFLADRAPEVAFYSEDRGLVVPEGGADPAWILVVTRSTGRALRWPASSPPAFRLRRLPTGKDGRRWRTSRWGL